MAYHLHWSYDTVMNMDHAERLRWVEEVSQINRRLNEESARTAAQGRWL